MNNLKDQRDWAPYLFNQYQQWAEIHPTDPNVYGPYSYKEPLGEDLSQVEIGCMEKCLKQSVWRIPLAKQRFVLVNYAWH